jgi:pyruvate ferredoxin oxidoreductase alpha subunit
VESCQEALDTVLQAFKVAEDRKILLPVMVCLDGFTLSHTAEVVEIPTQEQVREFLPPYTPDPEYHTLLDLKKPMVAGGGVPASHRMEFDYQKYEAQEAAKTVITRVDKEFATRFGRQYGLVEAYRCEDAEIILAGMGTLVGTAKEMVDHLRTEKGWPVGVLKLRCYRPFPQEAVRNAVASAKVVAVVNRAVSYGIGGPLSSDLATTLYPVPEKPMLLNFIAGLGGRDINRQDIVAIFEQAKNAVEIDEGPQKMGWTGLKTSLVGD